MERNRLNDALTKFIHEKKGKFDVGVCLNVPNKMRFIQSGNDDIWLQRHLSVYLNKVDRRIYKAAHKNRGVRTKRVVSLEYTKNTGWHAHMCVETPDGMTNDDLINKLGTVWLKYVSKWKGKRFTDERLFWADEIKEGYDQYTTKNGTNILNGNMDWHNTYLG
jgi:hypothetical protein